METMTFKKECKHSVVYESNNPDAPVTTVYVMKKALPTPFPDSITLEVKAAA